MAIQKSSGQTQTERYLSLGLWSYANPFKADGKELCDLIAVFENHVFLFFDRESRKFDRVDADVQLEASSNVSLGRFFGGRMVEAASL
jgi:hypothetical protein